MSGPALALAKSTLTNLGPALGLLPVPGLQLIPTIAIAIIDVAQVRASDPVRER